MGNVISGLKGKLFDDKYLNTGLDIAKLMLDKATIGMVPGEYFFTTKRYGCQNSNRTKTRRNRDGI